MNDQYVCQQDFNDFKEDFIRFEAANTERQKGIDHKLSELLDARNKGAEHDSTQATLITDLNNQVSSLGQQVSALRESRDTMRKEIAELKTQNKVLETEKRMLNRFWAIASGIAILLSPIVAEFVGKWLTS